MNETFSFHGYSINNQMFCVVQGDDIYQMDYTTGNQKHIGKTISAYNELEQTTTEYYDKLVELGVIVPPKDQQQAIAEMQDTMKDMAELIRTLSNEVKELKSNECKSDTGNGGEGISERKYKRSSRQGESNDTGNA